MFASKSLQKENIVAYTCNNEELVVRLINFTQPLPLIQYYTGFDRKSTLSIYSVDID